LSQQKHQEILADIYISADRVADNAKSLGVKYADELLRVIIHGALHLSGFNDNTKSKKQQMRDLEQTWMLAYSS
jgi:rRNA maturation RNase YbeY